LIGSNLTVPEGVPQDRIAALRKAFAATMKDLAFLAEAKKRKSEISPVSGVEVEKIVRKLFTASAEMIGKIKAAIGFK
jgi:tripartite-type tricarboxylate transporter receptor subunit TctC